MRTEEQRKESRKAALFWLLGGFRPNGSPCPFSGDNKKRYGESVIHGCTQGFVSPKLVCLLIVGGTGTFCRRQNFSHITCDVTHSSRLRRDTFPSQHLTFGSSCTVIFDQVRKARVRSTLGQHSVRMNSDHRNSFSRQTLAAGAGDRWSPLLCFFFLLCTISCPKDDEVRPVITATTNIPFLIERNSSVQ